MLNVQCFTVLFTFFTHSLLTLTWFARLTGCYAIKYGSRGYGHSGISSLGLMCDAKDLEWQWYICLTTKMESIL
jgi:hypothetical protein